MSVARRREPSLHAIKARFFALVRIWWHDGRVLVLAGALNYEVEKIKLEVWVEIMVKGGQWEGACALVSIFRSHVIGIGNSYMAVA